MPTGVDFSTEYFGQVAAENFENQWWLHRSASSHSIGPERPLIENARAVTEAITRAPHSRDLSFQTIQT
jgi:hypothetical protein